MAKKKKKQLIRKKIVKIRKKIKKCLKNKSAFAIISILILIFLFVATFFITTAIFQRTTEETVTTTLPTVEEPKTSQTTATEPETTTIKEITTESTTKTETTTKNPTTTAPSNIQGNTDYPSDTASWKLICLNRSRYVGSDVENKISLSYVAGSGERMDSRAASAYEKMYKAASLDGIYLTPCSGYRSYSTQKRLYYEFVNDYIKQGYSQSEAENLASKRRNPPGSSEHNIGICMDIICAASSANFQNTKEYAWLCENAADYGFILRYPEDKVSVTGVKFEPWHWRFVGVENAAKIKASGLCLEEYLGLV